MLAEKLKLSMPRPCALPVESVICHTSHNAAPGDQLVMARSSTLRLVWLRAEVPSTARPSVSAATGGKLTFKADRKAVALAGNEAVPAGKEKRSFHTSGLGRRDPSRHCRWPGRDRRSHRDWPENKSRH